MAVFEEDVLPKDVFIVQILTTFHHDFLASMPCKMLGIVYFLTDCQHTQNLNIVSLVFLHES